MKKVFINGKLIKSDHSGYCSDNECELEISLFTHSIDVPKEFINEPVGAIKDIDQHYWSKFMPEPKLNNSGSYYCRNSPKCKSYQLGVHDYKYIINCVEIIEINT